MARTHAILGKPAPPRPPTTQEDLAWQEKAKRTRDAINLLFNALKEQRAEAGIHIDDNRAIGCGTYRDAFDKLQAALETAPSVLRVEPPHKRFRPWHPCGFQVMNLAVSVLSEVRGGKAGYSRNSVAAYFSELMLRRMGIDGGDREAIAQLYACWMRVPDK